MQLSSSTLSLSIPSHPVSSALKTDALGAVFFHPPPSSPPSPPSTATTERSSSSSSSTSSASSYAWLDRSDSSSSMLSLDRLSSFSIIDAAAVLPHPSFSADFSLEVAVQARRALQDVTNRPPLQLPSPLPLEKATVDVSPATQRGQHRTEPLPPLSSACTLHLARDHQLVLLAGQSRLHCYNPAAPYLPHRPLLLSWLLEVSATALQLPPMTVHSAVALFDHLASSHPIPLPTLQLIGLTCIFLSWKFSLPFYSQPSAARLLAFTPGLYSVPQLCQAELAALARLHWTVDVITPSHFIDQWRAMHPHDCDLWACVDQLDRLCLHAYDLRAYQPALVACGLVQAARVMVGCEEEWDLPVDMGCEVEEGEVRQCAQRVLEVYEEVHGLVDEDGVDMQE